MVSTTPVRHTMAYVGYEKNRQCLKHLAFATLLAKAPRRDGTLGKLRLSPIQKALAQALQT